MKLFENPCKSLFKKFFYNNVSGANALNFNQKRIFIMRESHKKALVFAVCEDKTVHPFGSFYENTVGDDIYGSYRIETEVGHYSFTPEEEISGLISIMPDPIILQSYLAGEPHEEYDSIFNVLEINSKIKAFYCIYTDEEGGSDNLIITKITGDDIQEFND